MAARRRGWNDEWVYFETEPGKLGKLPVAWTSLAEADPFVVVAAGRSHFRLDDLLRLVEVIRRLEE